MKGIIKYFEIVIESLTMFMLMILKVRFWSPKFLMIMILDMIWVTCKSLYDDSKNINVLVKDFMKNILIVLKENYEVSPRRCSQFDQPEIALADIGRSFPKNGQPVYAFFAQRYTIMLMI